MKSKKISKDSIIHADDYEESKLPKFLLKIALLTAAAIAGSAYSKPSSDTIKQAETGRKFMDNWL